MRSVILLITLVASLWAIDTGSLSFFLMKEGKPLANQKLVIFKKSDTALIEMPSTFNRHAEFVTDSDGYVNTVLPVGTYQLQVLAKEDGKAQAFIKKPFVIEENKESQIIVSLQEDDTVAFEDDETPTVVDHKEDDNLSMRENGSVLISLVSSEDQAPVKDARVFVQGQSLDITSDAKGGVSLELPEGEHTLSIIHSDFSAQTVKVTVIANETVNKSYELSPSSMELEEFVVLAPQVQGSIASVVAEEKNSENISSIIGSEQMSKQGDSNAASALKRVSGVTLIGGKSVYVRGLGDRYSATEMNSMSLPSPNPLQRTIPLDLFPSSVIGSLEVQKTYSPDITGSFGGGYINVRTKKSVDDDYVKFKIGVNSHDSYGDVAPTYEGGIDDWTGYDHSFRPFPGAFVGAATPALGEVAPDPADFTPQEYQSMLQQRNVNNQTTSVPLGTEFEMEVGKGVSFSADHDLNFLATYGYKSEAKLQSFESYEYGISNGVQSDILANSATSDHYTETIRHGGVFNTNYHLNNFDIGYTLLYVLNTLDKTRASTGTFGENQIDQKKSLFQWQERELVTHQIAGGVEYEALVKNKFDFGAEVATATEYVPNDVSYNFTNEFGTGYKFSNQSALKYENRETIDDVDNYFIKNRSYIPAFSDEDYIELGGVLERKDRTYRTLVLQITDPRSSLPDNIASGTMNDIINYTDGSALSYDYYTGPADNYNAHMERDAMYAKAFVKPMDSLELSFGIRKVDLEQTVDQFYKGAGDIVDSAETKLDFSKTLPSITAKIAFDEQNQLRFAYSETYIYPDFREVAPAQFVHPIFDALVIGNPDLIETDIQSYDARYEYYFNPTDVFSIAVFYKQLDNPIEDTVVENTSGALTFSYDNAHSAEITGLEISANKSLDFISDALSDVSLSGNYTFLSSSVEFTDEQKARYVTDDRELQGLSPNVFNFAVNYNEEGSRSVNLSYNIMDKRLMRIGTENPLSTSVRNVYGLDQYEIPPELLDLTWIEQFESKAFDTNFALTFKAKNLLDGETEWIEGTKTILKYKVGRSYSLSLSAKF